MKLFRSSRPWRKHLRIDRVEYHSGDIKFVIAPGPAMRGVIVSDPLPDTKFETLTEAEEAADAFWRAWAPQQVKRRRRA